MRKTTVGCRGLTDALWSEDVPISPNARRGLQEKQLGRQALREGAGQVVAVPATARQLKAVADLLDQPGRISAGQHDDD